MQVGQKLFYVPHSHHGRQPQGYEVTVMGVGRKWVQVSMNGNVNNLFRIGIDDMCADGGQYTSPGKCWYSKELWEEEIKIQEEWAEFRKQVDRFYRAPKNLSLSEIQTLRAKTSTWL